MSVARQIRLAKAKDPRDRMLICLALVTGLRPTELCWLEWVDVREHGDGSDEIIVRGTTDGQETWVPKSHNQRHIPVRQEDMAALKKYHASHRPGPDGSFAAGPEGGS